ncbi:MAG: DUF4093 domain-containing protein [Clostridia bacterium]|nr:DUF4093 domain-containing protein [Clostridia bacterium]
MLKTDRIIITEGKYDKIKLETIINADIFITDGFSIFRDDKTKKMLFNLTAKRGAIIITDSDHAGFQIRNYLNNFLNSLDVINVFIPDINGKEKRKREYSKEGTLGVEGIDKSLLENLLIKALEKSEQIVEKTSNITNLNLYEDGFIGRSYSKEKRMKLLKYLSLPKNINKNTLLKILNSEYDYGEYSKIVSELNENK